MKNPVPERSPCSSVPRIFTTAFPDFSKISLTSRLMDAVEDSGAWTAAEGGVVSSARATATPPKNASASARLEPESCLITHWSTIQHVTRWCRGPVSFGAVFDSADERWAEVAGRDRIGKAPVRIRPCRGSHNWGAILGRDIHGLGSLINLQRNYRRADHKRRRHGGIGRKARHIKTEQEVLRPRQRVPSARLAP